MVISVCGKIKCREAGIAGRCHVDILDIWLLRHRAGVIVHQIDLCVLRRGWICHPEEWICRPEGMNLSFPGGMWFNINLGNGLVPEGTKPLPGPMLRVQLLDFLGNCHDCESMSKRPVSASSSLMSDQHQRKGTAYISQALLNQALRGQPRKRKSWSRTTWNRPIFLSFQCRLPIAGLDISCSLMIQGK